MVMIAGWGVGNITYPFSYGPRKHSYRLSRYVCEPPERFQRGTGWRPLNWVRP